MSIRALAHYIIGYHQAHAGTFGIIFRILVYILLLSAASWIADVYFAGSSLAQATCVSLGSATFEMAMAGTADSRRLVAYIVCLTLLVCAGGLLSHWMLVQSAVAARP